MNNNNTTKHSPESLNEKDSNIDSALLIKLEFNKWNNVKTYLELYG